MLQLSSFPLARETRTGLSLILVWSAVTIALSVAVGRPAFATTGYPDAIGSNVTFSVIQETSNPGDPEPLWGAPSVAGDQLVFTPTAFEAISSGGGIETAGSQLQLTITAHAGSTLDILLLEELGEVVFSGAGTAATGAYLSMSGFVTVLETTAGAIAPVVLPFVGAFTPGDAFTLPGDAGTTAWSGAAVIDIAAVVPDATVAFLSFDNDLVAASEAATTAEARKTEVRVSVVPEPSTALLLAIGVTLLARTRAPRR